MFAKECIPPKNVYCLKIQLKQLPLVCMFIMLIMEFTPKKVHFQWKKWKCHYSHCLIENNIEINSKQCSFRLLFFFKYWIVSLMFSYILLWFFSAVIFWKFRLNSSFLLLFSIFSSVPFLSQNPVNKQKFE